MKETSIHEKDKVVNVKSVQQEAQVKFAGGMTLHKGHSIWEFNKKTLEIKKAEMEKLPAKFGNRREYGQLNVLQRLSDKISNPQSVGKVIQKPECLYIPALSMKSALAKIGIKVKVVKNKKQ